MGVKRKRFVQVVGLVMALAGVVAVSAPAAFALTIGDPADPATGNCFPFGCSGTRYQQVYNSSLFPNPFSFNTVTFFNTKFGPGAGIIDTANYEIRFSETPKAVNGLDTSVFDNNIGVNDQPFFNGVLGGPIGPSMEFLILGSTYNYDPSQGNLLMDIHKIDLPGSGSVFLDARNGTFGIDSSRAHNFGIAFESWGLVTKFGETNGPGPGPVVPEPSTLLLTTLGLAGAGLSRRRPRI